jgi:hypothetical protein
MDMTPDFARLAAVPARCVVVTAQGGSDLEEHGDAAGADFVSRVFGPAVGINEDPVTGSAHCGLAPYWRARLGKSDLHAYQASKHGTYAVFCFFIIGHDTHAQLTTHSGGKLRLQVNDGGRVLISGLAVTVFHARLCRPPTFSL